VLSYNIELLLFFWCPNTTQYCELEDFEYSNLLDASQVLIWRTITAGLEPNTIQTRTSIDICTTDHTPQPMIF
jgi:hypothetical protein